MEWEAYDALDPVGAWRDDFRFGQVCATIVRSIHAALSGSTCEVSALDFIPKWGIRDSGVKKKKEETVRKQSVDEMKEILFSIAKHHSGGKVKVKRRK